MKIKNKGFTLIEIIVTVAIIGLMASVGVASYIHVVNNNRTKMDIAVFDNIGEEIQYYLTEDVIFDEIKLYFDDTPEDDDTLALTLIVSDRKIFFAEAYVGTDSETPLYVAFPHLYSRIIDNFGSVVSMNSNDNGYGHYTYTYKFNGVQLSVARDFTVNNDEISLTKDYLLCESKSEYETALAESDDDE